MWLVLRHGPRLIGRFRMPATTSSSLPIRSGRRPIQTSTHTDLKGDEPISAKSSRNRSPMPSKPRRLRKKSPQSFPTRIMPMRLAKSPPLVGPCKPKIVEIPLDPSMSPVPSLLAANSDSEQASDTSYSDDAATDNEHELAEPAIIEEKSDGAICLRWPNQLATVAFQSRLGLDDELLPTSCFASLSLTSASEFGLQE